MEGYASIREQVKDTLSIAMETISTTLRLESLVTKYTDAMRNIGDYITSSPASDGYGGRGSGLIYNSNANRKERKRLARTNVNQKKDARQRNPSGGSRFARRQNMRRESW